MESQQEKFEALLSNAEQIEKRARLRAWISSIIPIVVAGIFLAVTVLQIRLAQDELTTVQEELTDTEQTLDATTIEYEEAQSSLSEVQEELTETRLELKEADQQLVKIEAELQTANSLVAETQKQLEETTLVLTTAQQELETTQGQVVELEVQLNDLNQDITFAEEQLQVYREAETFQPYICKIEPEDAKRWLSYLDDNYTDQHVKVFNLLMELQLQGVKFSINGASIEEGYNSPNFATYILQKNNLLPPQYDDKKLPWEQLGTVRRLGQGDIVYYQSGYTMFYFFNENQRCVIGMTPAGIISLVPDFAEVLGYLKVPYPNQ